MLPVGVALCVVSSHCKVFRNTRAHSITARSLPLRLSWHVNSIKMKRSFASADLSVEIAQNARSTDSMPEDILPLIACHFDVFDDLDTIYRFLQTCRGALRALAGVLKDWFACSGWESSHAEWKTSWFIYRSLPLPQECHPLNVEYHWAVRYTEHVAALEQAYMLDGEKNRCTGILSNPQLTLHNAYVYDVANDAFTPLTKHPKLRAVTQRSLPHDNRDFRKCYTKFLESNQYTGSQAERNLLLLAAGSLSAWNAEHRASVYSLMKEQLVLRRPDHVYPDVRLYDVVINGTHLFDDAHMALRSTIYCFNGPVCRLPLLGERDETNAMALRLYIHTKERSQQLAARLNQCYTPPPAKPVAAVAVSSEIMEIVV